MKKLKKSIDKYFGGKSKKSNKIKNSGKSKRIKVATDMSYSNNKSNGFGKGGKGAIGLTYQEYGDSAINSITEEIATDIVSKSKATKVGAIKNNKTVSQIINNLLKKTGSSKSKSKKAAKKVKKK